MDSNRISPEEAHSIALSGEKVIFLDTESDRKIPDAIRLSVDEAERHVPAFDKDATIIAYCT